MLRINIIILFIICSKICFAQDTLLLDPVTVSASLKSLNVSKTGRNIIIIKGEMFSKLPVHSVDELLRYVPGIEVQSRGTMGSQSDIVIRGGTFQQVLVVLDGLRLNDPNSGHFTSYIPIAPAEIERIEIVKGASSALYGSEAVGGVISIITKSFAASLHSTTLRRAQGDIMLTAGEFGLWNINAGGTYQKKHTAISAGILSNNADGQQQRGTKGYFNNNTVSVSASHYFNDYLKLSFRTAYDKRRFSAQNFYTTFKSDTAHETVQSFWNQLNLTYDKNKSKFSFDAGYKNVKDEYAFNSAGAPNKNVSKLFQLLATNIYSFSSSTSLTTGAQFQNKVITSNDRGDHQLDQFAAFVILDKAFGNLNVTPAIRIDQSELVPQINLSYKLSNLQLRGSAGKTIRQADFTERYNNYNKTLVTSGSIGNPDLDAERSFSYEAGADLFLKSIKVSATAFKRDQSNVIDWTPTPYMQMPRKSNLSPTGNYALAKNIAKVETKGVETDFQYASKNIKANLGLLWLDSKSSDTVPSFYISSHAKFMGNFSVAYTNKYFSVSATGVYKKRNPQFASAINTKVDAECFMMNSKVDIFLIKQKVSIFGEVDNIFDNICGDLLGAQMPGRWFMGGIKFSL